LIGYDPFVDLPEDHLCRFVDSVVDSYVPAPLKTGPGQPPYDRRMTMKVLLFGYATGVRSSRRLDQNCRESLPYLLLVRDDRPSYRTLCTARCECKDLMDSLWIEMYRLAAECGMEYMGKIAVDSTKIRADVSMDSVVARKEMDEVLASFREILKEAEMTDAREDEEGTGLRTQTGVSVSDMREVLRRIRTRKTEKILPSTGLAKSIEQGVKTLEAAKAADLAHASLTDPDARMMPIGASRKIAMGHSFEAVADNGLLVVGQTHNGATDNDRLGILVAQAKAADPVPVTQVLADSGYFSGGIVNELLEQEGLDVVVPDARTAAAMRKAPEPGPDPIVFERVEGRNAYICPQGKLLRPEDRIFRSGQWFTTYVAETSCLECPLASRCLKNPAAKRRNLIIGEFNDAIKTHLARFENPEVRELYYTRGPAVETAFSIFRNIMRFCRWSLRGSAKVETEAKVLKAAYQIRKLHTAKNALAAAR
jgi:transposase